MHNRLFGHLVRIPYVPTFTGAISVGRIWSNSLPRTLGDDEWNPHLGHEKKTSNPACCNEIIDAIEKIRGVRILPLLIGCFLWESSKIKEKDHRIQHHLTVWFRFHLEKGSSCHGQIRSTVSGSKHRIWKWSTKGIAPFLVYSWVAG